MAVILAAIARLVTALGGLVFPALGGWVLFRAETSTGAISKGVSGLAKVPGAVGEVAESAGGGLGFLALAVVAIALLGGRR